MNKKRLLLLCRKLDKLQDKQFNYSVWVDESWQGKPDLSCGAPACALGHATTIPSLRALGLRMRRLLQYATGGYVQFKRQVVPGNTVETSLLAAMCVFDLTRDEAAYLFVPGRNAESSGLSERASAKTVARHIRKFIARGGLPKSRLPKKVIVVASEATT